MLVARPYLGNWAGEHCLEHGIEICLNMDHQLNAGMPITVTRLADGRTLEIT